MPDRQAMDAMFSVLPPVANGRRAHAAWAHSARSPTASARGRAGVFERLWRAGLLVYDTQVGIAWEGHAMDGAMTNAPLGGKGTGPNPTDCGARGVTRSRLTEGCGIPLAVAVDGANRRDMKLVDPRCRRW